MGKNFKFLVPTRRRGNAFSTCQHRGPQAHKDGTLARPESVPTPARGNQKVPAGWFLLDGGLQPRPKRCFFLQTPSSTVYAPVLK